MIVGLLLRNYKVYNGIKFIPLSLGDTFCAYFGQNGSGKSSILEALDTFFHERNWIVNKKKTDFTAKYSETSYIVPIFLIQKESLPKKTERQKETFQLCEKLSNYFWDIETTTSSSQDIKLFIEYKNTLKDKYFKDYLILPIGKINNKNISIYFGSLQNERTFLEMLNISQDEELDDKEDQKEDEDLKISDKLKSYNLIQYITNQYYYIYLPSEIDIEQYTRLESSNMQELVHKDVKTTILDSITDDMLKSINETLQGYIQDVSKELMSYSYSPKKQDAKELRKEDLLRSIIRAYFSTRVLSKRIKGTDISVNELSSGEKRKALVDVTVTLLQKGMQDRQIVLGIDEPEISLHVSACYEQFEKLRKLADTGCQVLITTHWYGFLPICGRGLACNIYENLEDYNQKRAISIFSLENYVEEVNLKKIHLKKKNEEENLSELKKLPDDVFLKSRYDLVQAIISSVRSDKKYKYLIVEGSSDKTYFSEYLAPYIKSDNLRILAVGGIDNVISLLNYLKPPLDEIKKEELTSCQIVGIVDNDEQQHPIKDFTDSGILKYRRIRYDKSIKDIKLEPPENKNNTGNITSVEDILEPDLFAETIKEILEGNQDNFGLVELFKQEKLNLDAKCSWNVISYTEDDRDRIKELFKKKSFKNAFARAYCEKNLDSRKCKVVMDIIKLFNFDESELDEEKLDNVISKNNGAEDQNGSTPHKKKVIVKKKKANKDDTSISVWNNGI